MAMSFIWCGILVISTVYAAVDGNMDAVGSAVVEGCGAAVSLCIGICGITCLWTGVLEIMNQSGLSAKLSRLLRPILRRLYPQSAQDPEALQAISANMSANMLGLGNAATPLGIRAAARMAHGGTATNDLCMLVIMNTASIQLIPTTVAGIRAAAGAAAPFDILPAVWITSAVSVSVGILAAKGLEKVIR